MYIAPKAGGKVSVVATNRKLGRLGDGRGTPCDLAQGARRSGNDVSAVAASPAPRVTESWRVEKDRRDLTHRLALPRRR